jgi:uncharacterized membrane protein YkgB
MDDTKTLARLPIALLLLRLGIAAVMIPWSIDKFVQPGHAQAVFGHFYGVGDVTVPIVYALGAIQLVLALGFLAGAWRTWTYGAALVMHALSTLASWRQYLEPYQEVNLLFFAAWPMLAACVALFMLRAEDRVLSLDAVRARSPAPSPAATAG